MISILTPTYNRAYVISRLADSLKKQSSFDFEWVVVDDGSTDNTHDVVENEKTRCNFDITYKKKENGGKHTVLNVGVPLCKGEWILIVDSDDYLTSDAVEVVANQLRNVKPNTVGMCFRKSYFDGETIGKPLINEIIALTPTEAGHYFQGDLAYVFRKSAMLKCPFPVFEGERFVPELCIWNKISDFGVILYYSGISFYRCEYLPDGYSANFKTNLRRNPKGFAYHYWDAIKRESGLKYKLKAFLRWLQCKFYMGKK
jgi:hypothetical protein